MCCKHVDRLCFQAYYIIGLNYKVFKLCFRRSLFQLVFFLLREFWRHLWKKQVVLWWQKEVSQHWYNHCTELCLPRTSKSLPYYVCTWSRTQLWLPGELLIQYVPHLCWLWRKFIRLIRFVSSSFNLLFPFHSPLQAWLWIWVHPRRIQKPRQEGEGQLYHVCKSYIGRQAQQQ